MGTSKSSEVQPAEQLEALCKSPTTSPIDLSAGNMLTDPSSRKFFNRAESSQDTLLAQGPVGAPVAPRYGQQYDIGPGSEEEFKKLALGVRESGEFKLAAEQLQLLRGIQEERFGKNSPEVGRTLLDLGLTYEGLGQFRDAEGCYRQGQRLSQEVAKAGKDKEKDFPIDSYQEGLARMRPFTFVKTESDLNQALKAYEVPEDLEEAYQNRGRNLLSADKPKEATEIFETLLRTQEHRHGAQGIKGWHAASTLFDLGLAYEGDEKLAQSKQSYQRGLEIAQGVYKDSDNETIPAFLTGLARIDLKEGKPKDASVKLETALKAYEFAKLDPISKTYEKSDLFRFGDDVARQIEKTYRLHASALLFLQAEEPNADHAIRAFKQMKQANQIEATLKAKAEQRKRELEAPVKPERNNQGFIAMA